MEAFNELIALSLAERRGLTLFVRGQVITGVVTEVIEGEALVLTSQLYRKIVVRLEAIDGMAIG